MVTKARRSLLSLALLSALGIGAAQLPSPAYAVNLADDGVGEVALFKYYTVRDDWQTFFRLVNTSDSVVAAKVRFREAQESRDVLDFVVVLSPFDVWNGWVGDRNGVPTLSTDDRSCIQSSRTIQEETTDDGRVIQRIPLSTNLVGGDVDRLREGHVEVISLGSIDPFDANPGSGVVINDVLHNANGVPNCSWVRTNFASTRSNNHMQNVVAPLFKESINALKANSFLLNIPRGQGAGVDPVMLANFYNPADATTGNIAGIGLDGTGQYGDNLIRELNRDNPNSGPDLNSAFPRISLVRDDTPGVGPRMVLDEWDRGVDAVSAVLNRTSVMNEWAARSTPDGAIRAFQTEWVVTFPTRYYYTNAHTDYGFTPLATTGRTVNPGDPSLAPFTGVVDDENCEPFFMTLNDREEFENSFFSPDFLDEGRLCNEVNVITFGTDNAALDERLGSEVGVGIPFAELPINPLNPNSRAVGWAEMEFTGANAINGLGSDLRADQVYNNQLRIYNYGETGAGPNVVISALDPEALCNPNNWVTGVHDAANPPRPTNLDNYDQRVPAGANPQWPDGLTNGLANTVFLQGLLAQPHIATPVTLDPTVFPIDVIVEGNCDSNTGQVDDNGNPLPPAGDAVNRVIQVPNLITYQGLPVLAFQFDLYEGGDAASSFAGAQAHGYRRSIASQIPDANGRPNVELCQARWFRGPRFDIDGDPLPQQWQIVANNPQCVPVPFRQ